MPAGEPPQAVISSPPYATKTVHGNHGLKLECFKEPGRVGKTSHAIGPREMDDYGRTDGQLAALPEGEPPAQAIVSSPPWEKSLDQGNVPKEARVKRARDMGLSADKVSPIDMENIGLRTQPDYGSCSGQLGNKQGDTFWSAARAILLQCYAVLAPGGHAIWVLKAFVRDKAIVDFPGQWRALCESCGFETVEVIRAWLVEDRGAQFALGGELVEKEVRRESFFRRLHRQKYPHLSIDYEVVLVTRKAA